MSLPVLTTIDGVFVCNTSFQDRRIPKQAGFRWSLENKVWYTEDARAAIHLREYADEKAKKEIERHLICVTAWDGKLPELQEGQTLYDHQISAIRFALTRNRSYLGLDPGLGKTIVAAVITEMVGDSIVYVCPPYLVATVEEEFKKWAPDANVARLTEYKNFGDVLLVPDSLLFRYETRQTILRFLGGAKQNTIFIDEAHRFKNAEAQRTRALLGYRNERGIVDLFERQVYMSGTPVPNRPIELYPILSKSAPETIDFMNKFDYGRTYCAAYRNQFGWDYSGASNVDALVAKIAAPSGPFMLRIRKDVLNLPPVVEELFVVGREMSPEVRGMGEKIGAQYRDIEDVIRHQIASAQSKDALHIATYRRLLGQEKVKPAVEYIKALLEETEEALLIFAIHKDVIAALESALVEYEPIVVTGDVPARERHGLVQSFQTNSHKRIFIGNIQACGTGFTLTKATRVLFVEYSWVPGENDQAVARAMRIGQKNTVFAQYMVYKDSIDKAVLESLLRKRKTLDKI